MALKTNLHHKCRISIIKIRTGCQNIRHFCYSENLIWTARNLRLGRMRLAGRGLDIADLNKRRLSRYNYLHSLVRHFGSSSNMHDSVKHELQTPTLCGVMIRHIYRWIFYSNSKVWAYLSRVSLFRGTQDCGHNTWNISLLKLSFQT